MDSLSTSGMPLQGQAQYFDYQQLDLQEMEMRKSVEGKRQIFGTPQSCTPASTSASPDTKVFHMASEDDLEETPAWCIATPDAADADDALSAASDEELDWTLCSSWPEAWAGGEATGGQDGAGSEGQHQPTFAAFKKRLQTHHAAPEHSASVASAALQEPDQLSGKIASRHGVSREDLPIISSANQRKIRNTRKTGKRQLKWVPVNRNLRGSDDDVASSKVAGA